MGAVEVKPGSTVTLRDGRRLGYAEYGEPDGRPVFYFHGTPGSRIDGRGADAEVRALGLRVIAVERPGYGLSTFVPRRTIASWPADVTELADALGIERFGVYGYSYGGPY